MAKSARASLQHMQTLPNHYIPDMLKEDGGQAPPRTHQVLSLRRDPAAPRMELAAQPPPQHPAATGHHGFPHIIIGGQPFYLIPSDPVNAPGAAAAAYEADAYAYPDNTGPIYEEIEESFEEEEEGFESDQGEVGSLQRLPPPSAGPGILQEPQVLRPTPRVLVNPLVRDIAFQEAHAPMRAPSNNVHVNSAGQQNPLSEHPLRGFTPISNRAPQPCDSLGRAKAKAAAALSSPAASNGSSSIYYYSDTLRPKAEKAANNTSSSSSNCSGRLSDDFSDSGFSHRSGSNKAKAKAAAAAAARSSAAQETVVVLDEIKKKASKNTTLV